jgi:cell division protein FtsQ
MAVLSRTTSWVVFFGGRVMSAVVRGGSQRSARPRSKAQAKPRGAQGRSSGRAPQGSGPAKIRAASRIGLKPGWALAAAGAVVALGVVVTLSTGDRLHRTGQAMADGVYARLAGAGFKVTAVEVEGATPMARASILRASGLRRDEPILGLDLNDLRGRIEHVGWVKSAKVVRLLPDTVVISVSQRQTAAVWQHGGHTLVVDDTGQPIPEADPARFADLPLVVGDGANEAAGDILPQVRARPRLMARLDALVRVDDRRWDLRLKDGGLIQLPATNEDSALIQLDQLDQKERILDLGLARIDLRDPELVAVRPKDGAAPSPPAAGA